MTVNVHNPRELEYAPIGETLARHVTIPELSELILARFSDEGIEDLVVSPESQNLGAGCGSFAAGAATAGALGVFSGGGTTASTGTQGITAIA